MPKVYINKDGYVSSPYIRDANIEIEVTDDIYKKIQSFPINSAWKYTGKYFILESLYTDDCLKDRRERECFRIIDNRSTMWYNHLTDEQKQELDKWYQAWLNVTETKIIPTKPEWLK